MSQNKNSKSGLGLMFGIIIGAIGGVFLAPKSGKENREAVAKKMGEMKEMIVSGEVQEKVKKIFGDVSEESIRFYNRAREEVMEGLETLKSMDGDDYAAMVQDIVENIKESTKTSAEKISRLKDQLIKDWPLM